MDVIEYLDPMWWYQVQITQQQTHSGIVTYQIDVQEVNLVEPETKGKSDLTQWMEN